MLVAALKKRCCHSNSTYVSTLQVIGSLRVIPSKLIRQVEECRLLRAQARAVANEIKKAASAAEDTASAISGR